MNNNASRISEENPGNSGNLYIIESPWSGRSVNQPDDNIIIVRPESEKEVTLSGLSGKKYNLLVLEVTNESIHLEVDGLSLKQGEELNRRGINLRGCAHQDFYMNRGELVELNTCSMDSGVKWQVFYLE